jgi:hypothetical protein
VGAAAIVASGLYIVLREQRDPARKQTGS